MPKFIPTGADNFPGNVDPGDYPYTVIGAKQTVSNGEKTRGKPQFELLLQLEPSKAKVTAKLIFAENMFWKIETFTKSAGFDFALNQEVEITPQMCIGRRGWCSIIHKPGNKEGVNFMEVDKWLTDKEKLPPITVVPTASAVPQAAAATPKPRWD